MVRSITVTFDQPINHTPGAFSILNTSTSAVFAIAAADIATTDNTTFTLTFDDSTTGIVGGSLADGDYTLTIDKTKVTAATGGAQMSADHTDEFFRRFADTNGDRIVGIGEFGGFRATFGKFEASDEEYDELFDFDGDGVVGITDFGQFRSRFGNPF